MTNPPRKIRVLIVDDSAIVRKILTDALSAEPDIEVAGTAPDPIVAMGKIERLRPDVLTLDIEMPRMDGLTFLKQLMSSRPMPVILVSSLAQSSCEAAMEALRLGAVEVLAKPGGPYSIGDLRDRVAACVRAAAGAQLKSPLFRDARIQEKPTAIPPPSAVSSSSVSLIAIGASTGGTEAIATVLAALPPDAPPIVITQHIPPAFSAAFAQRLNRICRMEVREARDQDVLRPGLALVAPGGFHLAVQRSGSQLVGRVKDGPLVHYQRPAVDVLFFSAAEAADERAVGVLLTGMGKDGAEGLLAMHKRGARTIAQDEATCVVFGMPREAIRNHAVDRVLPLSQIGAAILSAKSSMTAPSTAAPHRIA